VQVVTSSFKIAAAQYSIDAVADFSAWQTKVARWVQNASAEGANLLIFPEYASMELSAIDPATVGDLEGSLRTVIAAAGAANAHYRALAMQTGVTILGSSMPTQLANGQVVNRATLFVPDGRSGFQDKIVMTRFEREQWNISGGDTLRLFRTKLGPIGISICYDIEFPIIARAQAEAGAKIILAPSCTDTMQGYWRVRIGAQARALENQCFVVQAPTVGMAPWSVAVDENYGAAGVFVPPDGDSPNDGVAALGKEGEGSWLYAEIDLKRVSQWREDGAVRSFSHWPEQFFGQPQTNLPVEVVSLD
jgi:predicted amidohydrolase